MCEYKLWLIPGGWGQVHQYLYLPLSAQFWGESVWTAVILKVWDTLII